MDISVQSSDDQYHDDLLICVASANRQAEELREENSKLLKQVAELAGLEAEVIELRADVAELKTELADARAELDETKAELAEARADKTVLEAEIEDLKQKQATAPTPLPPPPSHKQPTTIAEEEDDLGPPETPSKSFPRQSIGQWSVERLRNNMSVKSMVNSMERSRIRER